MTRCVVDASVAVKWVLNEEHSDDAARLPSAGADLCAPALIYAEASSALWAAHLRRDLTDADLEEAVEVLLTAPLRLPVPMSELAPSASRIAVALRHPIYNCFYLALALREGCPVVTADRRFIDVVKDHARWSPSIAHVGDFA